MTGSDAGRTTVEATLDDRVARATVDVLPAVLAELTSTQSSVEVGQSVVLRARATYSNGAVEDVSNETTWSVQPSSAARVIDGRLEALAEGRADGARRVQSTVADGAQYRIRESAARAGSALDPDRHRPSFNRSTLTSAAKRPV